MLTPKQVREFQFEVSGRNSYKAANVDAFMSEVCDSYDQMFRQNAELIKKIGLLADKLTEYKKDEETIRNSIIAAERTKSAIIAEAQDKAKEVLTSAEEKVRQIKVAVDQKTEEIIDNANKEAERIVAEADSQADAIVTLAQSNAKKLLAEAQKMYDEQVETIKSESEKEQNHLNRIKSESAKVRKQLLETYKTQIQVLEYSPDFSIEEDVDEAEDFAVEESAVEEFEIEEPEYIEEPDEDEVFEDEDSEETEEFDDEDIDDEETDDDDSEEDDSEEDDFEDEDEDSQEDEEDDSDDEDIDDDIDEEDLDLEISPDKELDDDTDFDIPENFVLTPTFYDDAKMAFVKEFAVEEEVDEREEFFINHDFDFKQEFMEYVDDENDVVDESVFESMLNVDKYLADAEYVPLPDDSDEYDDEFDGDYGKEVDSEEAVYAPQDMDVETDDSDEEAELTLF